MVFQMNDLPFEGVHKFTFESIMKCDVDVRKDLYFKHHTQGLSGFSLIFFGSWILACCNLA